MKMTFVSILVIQSQSLQWCASITSLAAVSTALNAAMTMYMVTKHPPQSQQRRMKTLGHTLSLCSRQLRNALCVCRDGSRNLR